MEKLKINIHPTFIIFACILIYFGKAILFFNYVLVMFLHEMAHAFVARRLGYNIKNIRLIPFGICLNMNSCDLVPKDEIKIALAGPIVNLILVLITLSLWWVFPYTYNYTYLFCYCNFITAIFNLVPAFPLDGGRVLLSVLKQKVTTNVAIKFCKVVNIVMIIVLLGLFILSCFYSINLTFLFVILCLLSGVLDNNKMSKYTLINYGVLKKMGSVVRTKPLVVINTTKMYKLCKFIDNFSYISVTVIDENKIPQVTLTETQFLNLLEKYGASTNFITALKQEKFH